MYPNASGVLLGARQLNAFARWRVPDSVEHVLMVSSVPLLTISHVLARVIYAVEKESYPLHESAADVSAALSTLAALRRGTARTLYAIGGDLHHAARSTIAASVNGTRVVTIESAVTSGVTRGSTAVRSWHVMAMAMVASLLPPSVTHQRDAGTTELFQQSMPTDFFLGANFLLLDVSARVARWEWVYEELPPRQAVVQWLVVKAKFATLTFVVLALVTYVVLLLTQVQRLNQTLSEPVSEDDVTAKHMLPLDPSVRREDFFRHRHHRQ